MSLYKLQNIHMLVQETILRKAQCIVCLKEEVSATQDYLPSQAYCSMTRCTDTPRATKELLSFGCF